MTGEIWRMRYGCNNQGCTLYNQEMLGYTNEFCEQCATEVILVDHVPLDEINSNKSNYNQQQSIPAQQRQYGNQQLYSNVSTLQNEDQHSYQDPYTNSQQDRRTFSQPQRQLRQNSITPGYQSADQILANTSSQSLFDFGSHPTGAGSFESGTTGREKLEGKRMSQGLFPQPASINSGYYQQHDSNKRQTFEDNNTSSYLAGHGNYGSRSSRGDRHHSDGAQQDSRSGDHNDRGVNCDDPGMKVRGRGRSRERNQHKSHATHQPSRQPTTAAKKDWCYICHSFRGPHDTSTCQFSSRCSQAYYISDVLQISGVDLNVAPITVFDLAGHILYQMLQHNTLLLYIVVRDEVMTKILRHTPYVDLSPFARQKLQELFSAGNQATDNMLTGLALHLDFWLERAHDLLLEQGRKIWSELDDNRLKRLAGGPSDVSKFVPLPQQWLESSQLQPDKLVEGEAERFMGSMTNEYFSEFEETISLLENLIDTSMKARLELFLSRTTVSWRCAIELQPWFSTTPYWLPTLECPFDKAKFTAKPKKVIANVEGASEVEGSRSTSVVPSIKSDTEMTELDSDEDDAELAEALKDREQARQRFAEAMSRRMQQSFGATYKSPYVEDETAEENPGRVENREQ